MTDDDDDDPLPIFTDDEGAPPTLAESSRSFAAIRDEVRKQTRWEGAVVKRLCQLSGRPQAIQELIRAQREKTGNAQLYFDNFREMFPTFPVWLHCLKIPYVHETDLRTLFRPGDFAASKLYQVYCEQVADHTAEGSAALVFEWLHRGGRFKILHSYAYPRHLRGFRLEIPVEQDGQRTILWLENLADFAWNCGWLTDTGNSGSDREEE